MISLKKSIVSLEQETEELQKQLIKLKRDERFIKAFTESSRSYPEIISFLHEEYCAEQRPESLSCLNQG